MKVTGVKAVTILEPYADEYYQEHTWRAVIDFTIEYLWAWVDLDPAIRAYEYLFKVGTPHDVNHFSKLCSVMEGSYGIDIHIQGWKTEYLSDFLALKTEEDGCVFTLRIVGP